MLPPTLPNMVTTEEPNTGAVGRLYFPLVGVIFVVVFVVVVVVDALWFGKMVKLFDHIEADKHEKKACAFGWGRSR